MRLTLSPSPLATQRNPLAEREALGARADGERPSDRRSCQRVTVPSSVLATQTTPFCASTSSGLVPTGMGSPMRSLVLALSRVRVPPRELETQTVVPSTAMPSGPSPAAMVSTTLGAVALPGVVRRAGR